MVHIDHRTCNALQLANVHDSILSIRISNDIINGFGEVCDVSCVETCHADTTVLGHVDVVLVLHGRNLLFIETGETVFLSVCDSGRTHQRRSSTYLNMPI